MWGMDEKGTKIGDRKWERIRQTASVLMGFFVFFSPFPRITSIKEICFYAGVGLCAMLAIARKHPFSYQTPLSLPLMLLAGWALVGVFFSLDVENSFHDWYSHLVKYLLLYFALIHCFPTRKDLVVLARLVVASAALFSVLGLVYYYGILHHPLETRFGMHFTEGRDLFAESPTNLIGVLTVFAIVLAIQLVRIEKVPLHRNVAAVCILPLAAATLLTQTRSSLLALFVAIFVLLFSRRKLLLAVTGFLLIAVLVTLGKDRLEPGNIVGNERLGFYGITLQIIGENPLTGTGMGIQIFDEVIDRHHYNNRLPEAYRLEGWQVDEFAAPHNLFLSVAMRLGIPGLAFFLFLLTAAVRTCIRLIRDGNDFFLRSWGYAVLSALCMFLVKGLFEPIFNHFPEVVFFTVFSMITILWRLHTKAAPRTTPT